MSNDDNTNPDKDAEKLLDAKVQQPARRASRPALAYRQPLNRQTPAAATPVTPPRAEETMVESPAYVEDEDSAPIAAPPPPAQPVQRRTAPIPTEAPPRPSRPVMPPQQGVYVEPELASQPGYQAPQFAQNQAPYQPPYQQPPQPQFSAPPHAFPPAQQPPMQPPPPSFTAPPPAPYGQQGGYGMQGPGQPMPMPAPTPAPQFGGPGQMDVPDDLLPSLQRLAHAQRRGRVPFVQQTESADCGSACLAMVLKYNGRDVSLDEVRESIGSGRDGADAASIVRGSEWFGLRGRGLSLDVEQMKYLPRGTILHWEFQHFVVLDRMRKDGSAEIVDPARGSRIIPAKQLRESFTGVALVFEPTEKFEKKRAGDGRLKWYLEQLFGQRRLLIRIMTVSLLLRVFALALPLLTALVVDRVVPRNDPQLLFVIATGVGGVLVFQSLTTLIRTHLFLQLRTNLDTRLTLGFVDYLARLPFDFFQRRSSGDLMMRVNNNATIREMLTSNTLSALLDGVLVIAYLVLIIIMSPSMAAIVGALGFIQVTVFIISRRPYRELQARALDAQARSQSYLVELFAGMATLKACAAEGRAVERWSNLYIDELNVSLERGRVSAIVDGIIGLLSSASPVIILVVGALSVMSGKMSLGTMLAVNTIAMSVLGPLQTLVSSALQLQLVGSYMDRIDDVLSQPPEQGGENAARAPKLTGRVTLQNVSFRYSDRAPLVVRDVSLDIKPGMSIAIVGRSGCGKSTLASMIAGLYRPVEGRILYDGQDMARMELKSLRRQLGTVFQSPYLFGGSVRSNVALTEPALSLDRIIAAARLAVIHDDIDAMPMGYETLLADGGSSMSGGQRQRIALARALVHRPAVLILDEATSALDAETEARVMENLNRLSCTRIVLAHRLSTIASADLILVMSAGEVIESGTHAELIARNGHYKRLFAAQLNHNDDKEPS